MPLIKVQTSVPALDSAQVEGLLKELSSIKFNSEKLV